MSENGSHNNAGDDGAPDGQNFFQAPPKRVLLIERDLTITIERVVAKFRTEPDIFEWRGRPVQLIHHDDGRSSTIDEMTKERVVHLVHRCFEVQQNKSGTPVPATFPVDAAQLLLGMDKWGFRRLRGITTAPLLRPDGGVQQTVGYDRGTQMWCETSARLILPESPTKADAETALRGIREFFATMAFKDSKRVQVGGQSLVDIDSPPGADESAFLNGLLTAVVRPSLELAPGLMISAPAISGAGVGKGLLGRAISEIAYGEATAAINAGDKRTGELDKRIEASLFNARQVLLLDNMNNTALKSDTLASVLTELLVEARTLGRSVIRQLQSRIFVLVTGNGLIPSEDLIRRFLCVTLDAGEDPEARRFKSGFLTQVSARRSELLSAVLTIWCWARQNRSEIIRGAPWGSYEVWSEWVRDPLLTLGCQDPVLSMLAAKERDPERERTRWLFRTMRKLNGRKGIRASELQKEIVEFIDPAERGRQYITSELMALVGARVDGLVLTRDKGAGGWSTAVYAVLTTEEEASLCGRSPPRSA